MVRLNVADNQSLPRIPAKQHAIVGNTYKARTRSTGRSGLVNWCVHMTCGMGGSAANSRTSSSDTNSRTSSSDVLGNVVGPLAYLPDPLPSTRPAPRPSYQPAPRPSHPPAPQCQRSLQGISNTHTYPYDVIWLVRTAGRREKAKMPFPWISVVASGEGLVTDQMCMGGGGWRESFK